jgi:hypothetical protein
VLVPVEDVWVPWTPHSPTPGFWRLNLKPCVPTVHLESQPCSGLAQSVRVLVGLIVGSVSVSVRASGWQGSVWSTSELPLLDVGSSGVIGESPYSIYFLLI